MAQLRPMYLIALDFIRTGDREAVEIETSKYQCPRGAKDTVNNYRKIFKQQMERENDIQGTRKNY